LNGDIQNAGAGDDDALGHSKREHAGLAGGRLPTSSSVIDLTPLRISRIPTGSEIVLPSCFIFGMSCTAISLLVFDKIAMPPLGLGSIPACMDVLHLHLLNSNKREHATRLEALSVAMHVKRCYY